MGILTVGNTFPDTIGSDECAYGHPSNSRKGINLMKGILRLCEVGVLLPKDHEEFEQYATVWDREWGYYNENDILYEEADTEEAIQYAREYVNKGVDMTYAIVCNEGDCHYELPLSEQETSDMTYDPADVIFCIAKINGEIIEDFMHLKS